MSQKTYLVTLPTEDKTSNLLKCVRTFNNSNDENIDEAVKGELVVGFGKYSNDTFYQKLHLYGFDKSTVGVGDYFFDMTTKTIQKLITKPEQYLENTKFKVVVCTDTSLGLPGFPDGFLEEYVTNGLEYVELLYN